jgi:hypothetical protein
VSDITSLRGAHTDSGLYPIIGQMERAAGLGRDDLALAKLEKLDAVLARTSTSIEDAALFAEMLSLPNDGRHPALDLTPQQHRQRTFDALSPGILPSNANGHFHEQTHRGDHALEYPRATAALSAKFNPDRKVAR